MAKKYKVDYCLTNELKVRHVIKSEGYNIVGTLGILLKAYAIGTISKQNCVSVLKYIQSNPKDYRFHPKLIDSIINKIFESNL